MTPSATASPDPELLALLRRGLETEASDLHLVAGYPPVLRVHGRLVPVGATALTAARTAALIASVLPPHLQAAGTTTRRDFDFAFALPTGHGAARFRINVFHSQGAPGACFRFIPSAIPSFEWMGVPLALARRMASLPSGLVLITGVTGSGKTTTLAGLVEMINQAGHRRIVTVEEPIEYIFQPAGSSVISQREVGLDVDCFAEGLKYALRQDPDVILCGEIRDRETAQMAISAAETGHLVMSTLHTQDAKGAITRMIDVFPVDQHQDVRGQLSLSLRFVVSQRLLPNVNPEERRVLALEVLVATDPVRAAIRMNKIESIDSLIQTGKSFGMQALDENLAYLACNRRITAATAHRFSKNPAGMTARGVPQPGLEEEFAV